MCGKISHLTHQCEHVSKSCREVLLLTGTQALPGFSFSCLVMLEYCTWDLDGVGVGQEEPQVPDTVYEDKNTTHQARPLWTPQMRCVVSGTNGRPSACPEEYKLHSCITLPGIVKLHIL